jgi:hypothetical protein
MPKGTATGVDREYQVRCRDVLTHRDQRLTPWSADGIDVPITLADTTWTFDVALRCPDGSAVVAECKRLSSSIKQAAAGEFAWRVERLREAIGCPVAAYFFVKTAHQLGAIRVSEFGGFEPVVLDQDSQPPGFNIVFLSYDAERMRKLRHFVMSVPSGSTR